MNLFIVNISCTNKMRCHSKIVANDREQAVEMVKTQFHSYVEEFIRRPVHKDLMFRSAEIEVKEVDRPTILKLDWE